MKIYSYFNRKFLRLLGSKNVLKINFLFHKLFGEKDLGILALIFQKKKLDNLLSKISFTKKIINHI